MPTTACRADAIRHFEEVESFRPLALARIAAAPRPGLDQAVAEFGKGRHAAALNMGDCFAYACARANRAKLLFKGDDFTKTDVGAAG